MIKNINYDNKWLPSLEVDGVPHAMIRPLLEHIIPGAWDDYQQVLNSNDDFIFDLDVKCVQGTYIIPVTNISKWLYSFSLRNMSGELYERFRVFRRDVEKVYRVAWALEVEDLVVNRIEDEWRGGFDSHSIYELYNIFLSYGIPEEQLQDIDEEGRVHGPLHYLEYVCSGSYCGSRGHLVCDMIQYIESLPNGEQIFNHINESLSREIPGQVEYLDDYLDTLNVFISDELSRFIGEL